MKNYLSVLKLLLKNIFRKRSDKNSSYIWIAYVIIALTALGIAFSISVGLYTIAPHFNDPNILITYLFIVSFFVVIFFSLLSMLAYLYFSKDTEFFFSLPIKPSTIYFAKLTIVYMVELLTVLVVLAPSLLFVGISLSFGPVYYLTMLLAIFIVPAFPLVFTSVIAIPLMYLISFLKRKSAIMSITTILLFAGIMAAYMIFMTGLQSNLIDFAPTDFEQIILSIEEKFTVWGYIFYPFLCLSRFATMTASNGGLAQSMLINFAVFIASAAILFFLAVAISNKVYRRGATKNLENRSNAIGARENVSRSVIKSLMIQEWKEIFRTTTFAFQCLSGLIMCPLMTFLTIYMFSSLGVNASGTILPWLSSSFLITIFSGGLNIYAQTAITRQGKAFYYSKIIPVDYKIQLKAKMYLYTLLSGITVALSILVAFTLLQNWWMALLMAIYLMVYNYAANCFSIWFDLKDPKLNWTTHTEAVKQNKNVVVNTLINMAAGVMLSVIALLAYSLLSIVVSDVLAVIIALTIAGGISAVFAIVFHNQLFANVNKYYYRLS